MATCQTYEVSSSPRSLRDTYSGSSGTAQPSRAVNAPLRQTAPTRPHAGLDTSLPTMLSIGGGLATTRVVKQLPANTAKTLGDAVNYLLTTGDGMTAEDRAIVAAVQERQQKNDYRLVINGTFNLKGTDAANNPLHNYLQEKTVPTGDGPMKMNMADIAVVSHEEGGAAPRYLDSLL